MSDEKKKEKPLRQNITETIEEVGDADFADKTKGQILEALKKAKTVLDDTGDIIPGMGMIIHGLAAAVIDAMRPPDSLLDLKKTIGDVPLNEMMMKEKYPQIHEEVESKAADMAELMSQCHNICEMEPKDIVDQAIQLVRHTKLRKMTKNSDPEGWRLSKEEDGEKGADDVDAPLKDGWASNCKGNG